MGDKKPNTWTAIWLTVITIIYAIGLLFFAWYTR